MVFTDDTVDKIKMFCLMGAYVITSILIILKNNESSTIKLNSTFEYIAQGVQGILLWVAWNAHRLNEIMLNADDKQLILDIKEQNNIIKEQNHMISENLSVIATSRISTRNEPILQNHNGVVYDENFLSIPKSYLDTKNKKFQMGDYMVEISDTAR